MSTNSPVIERMQELIQVWDKNGNAKALFLNCYRMMTANTLDAIAEKDFHDSAWVKKLLDHFADYYFVALDAYEADLESAPRIWQIAFNAAVDEKTSALQNLLLGVNAHINYDLALAVADLLESEWDQLSDAQRKSRFNDYCHINDIIAQTIDAVQDQVLEPAMPAMDFIDRLMGRYDELLISHLISEWRGDVWKNVRRLLDAKGDAQRALITTEIEAEALKIAKMII